jgi:hypothetical protein
MVFPDHVSVMSRQASNRSRADQSDGSSPRAPGCRRAGLGPVGSSMIELIGVSLLAKGGALQAQSQAAIWSKL